MSLLPPVVGELVMDDSRWKGPASRAPGELRGIGDEAHRSTGMLGGMGKAVGVLGAAMAAVGVVDFLGDAIDEYQEARKVGAQTNAVIKSTGGVANVSAKQVGDLADSLSKKTAVDDEVIASGANMLLTFTRVRNEVGDGNDILNQATKSALDMSKALGTDMTSAAMTVGKALNDPIAGLAALRRAGVQFTDEQEKSIKTMVEQGDVMGAQKAILAELTTQFGGSAEAQATGLDRLSVMWGNAKEKVGEFAAKVIDAGINAVPKLLGPLQDLGQKMKPIWDEMVGGVRAFGAAFEGGAGDVGGSGFAGQLESLGGKLRPIFDDLLASIGPFFERVKGFLEENGPVFEQWGAKIAGVLSQVAAMWTSSFALIAAVVSVGVAIITDMWDRFGSHLWQHIQTAFNTVVQVLSAALQIIQGIFAFFTAVITGDWQGAWDAILSIVDGVWDLILGVIKFAVNAVSTIIGAAVAWISAQWSFMWNAAFTLAEDVWDGITSVVSSGVDAVISFVASLPGRVLGALGDLGSLLFSAGINLIEGMIRGILSMAGRIAQSAADVVKGAVRAAWDAIVPGSPSKIGTAIGANFGQGIAQGLDQSRAMVANASTGLMGSVTAGPAITAGAGGYTGGGGGTVIHHTTVLKLGDAEIARVVDIIRDEMHHQADGVPGYLP